MEVERIRGIIEATKYISISRSIPKLAAYTISRKKPMPFPPALKSVISREAPASDLRIELPLDSLAPQLVFKVLDSNS